MTWHRDRIIGLILMILAAVALPGNAQNPPEGWSEQTHGADAAPSYDVVFPEQGVLELSLEFASQDWESMISQESDQRMAHATVRFNDRSWAYVQVTISERAWAEWQDGLASPDLLIQFNSQEFSDQHFYGFSQISLHSSAGDPSLVRTKAALDIMREAGVPTPRASLCHLTVETANELAFTSIYTMIEVPGKPMLKTQFDESDGSLYRVDGDGARLDGYDPMAFVPSFLADTQHNAPLPEVVHEALHADNLDARSWRIALESSFDVYGFLRWLAVRTVFGSRLGYGFGTAQLSLYWDPGDRRYHWIPIDELPIAPLNAAGGEPISLSLGDVDPEWPLIRLLADDPAYKGTYNGYVNEFLKDMFHVGSVHERLRQTHRLIEPYVLQRDDTTQQDRFLPFPDVFFAGLDELLFAIEDRYAQGSEYLDSIDYREPAIIISELHYNPSLEQGIDNNFEFVELFNRGNRTVDLSGYMFIEGLLVELPPGTSVSPGQCLLLSKRAATYRDAPCQVQQWVRGSLSNGGEIVRLINREGVEVDSVAYDDVLPWPELADAGGSSLEIVDPRIPNYTVANWRASDEIGGSPGWVSP